MINEIDTEAYTRAYMESYAKKLIKDKLLESYKGDFSELERNYHFGGAWIDSKGKFISIKEVKYNNPVTIVFWNDGTKTTCKCQEEDIYSKEMGLVICTLKKLKSNWWVQKLIKDWVPQDASTEVSLKTLRKKERHLNK